MKKWVLGGLLRGYRYHDIGHSTGSIIWWITPNGKLVKNVQKEGGVFHYNLMEGLKYDEDDVWRGRATSNSGGVVTVIPPVHIYKKRDFDLSDSVFNSLERNFKPQSVYMETGEGMKRVAKQTIRRGKVK